MSRISIAYQYLLHRYKSKGWDSFHSPYLFKLFTYCCDKKNHPAIFDQIEEQRKKLHLSTEVIHRKDLGAGSSLSKPSRLQKISTIARTALSFPFQCRFLSRLAQFSQAKYILEFGTSLGISGSYLACGATSSRLITVEGDPGVSLIADKIFKELGLSNISLVNSTFEEFLSTGLDQIPSIDLLFLDGNHQSEALIQYYTSMKSLIHPGTIIVVDDIYWSEDMHHGWKQLIQLPEITQSVDCFHFGLLFFNDDFLNKENHTIRIPLL